MRRLLHFFFCHGKTSWPRAEWVHQDGMNLKLYYVVCTGCGQKFGYSGEWVRHSNSWEAV